MSDSEIFPYLVTLAWGDVESPTIASVVYLSLNSSENTKSLAEALQQINEIKPSQQPGFDWSTLHASGRNVSSDQVLEDLLNTASQGLVGIARVTAVRLSQNK